MFKTVYLLCAGIRHVLLRSETVGMPLTSHTRLTQRQAEFMSSGASGGIAVTMATILSSKICF